MDGDDDEREVLLSGPVDLVFRMGASSAKPTEEHDQPKDGHDREHGDRHPPEPFDVGGEGDDSDAEPCDCEATVRQCEAAEGHADARREMVRREETLRRELVEDLLRGDAHLGELVQRAEPFGLDLTRAHQIALAAPGRRLPVSEVALSALERIVLDRFGDRDVLVATKDGLVVVLAPEHPRTPAAASDHARVEDNLGRLMHAELGRLRGGRPWRVAVGRAHAGAYGIARSYEEAREGLTMAARMHLDNPVVEARDLLIYRVLFRDQPAIIDLVHAVLSPLSRSRGGARPLLDTLDAYCAAGNVATEAAAGLHLSVRAVTYRLEKVRKLTGFDPLDASHRFTIHAAALDARLLGWPEHELSPPEGTR